MSHQPPDEKEVKLNDEQEAIYEKFISAIEGSYPAKATDIAKANADILPPELLKQCINYRDALYSAIDEFSNFYMRGEYNPKGLEILLTMGADPNKKHAYQKTSAFENLISCIRIKYLPGSENIFQSFLEHGADPNAITETGSTIIALFLKYSKKRDDALVFLELLLKFGGNPNIIDSAGTSILSLLRNNMHVGMTNMLLDAIKKNPPPLEWQAYQARLDRAKKVGHVLGVTGAFKTQAPPGLPQPDFMTMQTGFGAYESNCYFLDCLQKYIERHSSLIAHNDDFSNFFQSLKGTNQYLSAQGKITDEMLAQRFKDKKLLIVPFGSPTHIISIALYGDYLVLCNRGRGKLETGTSIFKLTAEQKNKINTSFIQSLNSGRNRSIEEVLEQLSNLVDLNKPFARLPTKPQGYGTCSYVNQKATLEGALFLFELERLAPKTDEDREKAIVAAKKYARHEYKKFTKGSRDDEVDDLITEYVQEKSSDTENALLNRQMYLFLFERIIAEHHGQRKLDFAEIQRQQKHLDPDVVTNLIIALRKSRPAELNAMKKEIHAKKTLTVTLDGKQHTFRMSAGHFPYRRSRDSKMLAELRREARILSCLSETDRQDLLSRLPPEIDLMEPLLIFSKQDDIKDKKELDELATFIKQAPKI